MALISVGIPTYQNADTIAATIASLLRQNFADWECIVTDDSPGDATMKAAFEAASGDSRFRFVRNDTRLGAAGNWNKTLEMATAPFFKLLCADDILTPDALIQQVRALELNPTADIACGRRDIITAKGRRIIRNRGLHAGPIIIDGLDAIKRFAQSGSNFFGEPSFVLFRTDALRRAGGFNSDWSYLIDVESYLRVLQNGDLAPVDACIGGFRISGTSWSSRLARTQRAETWRAMDYAAAIKGVKVNPLAVAAGKLTVVIGTVLRRAIFSIATIVG